MITPPPKPTRAAAGSAPTSAGTNQIVSQDPAQPQPAPTEDEAIRAHRKRGLLAAAGCVAAGAAIGAWAMHLRAQKRRRRRK